jgi:hypothetical protein
LRARLTDAGLVERVLIPADGETLSERALDAPLPAR